MRFYTGRHRYYCGIDLHARNTYLCILDHESGEVALHRNLRCELQRFLRAIEPYRDNLSGCGSESDLALAEREPPRTAARQSPRSRHAPAHPDAYPHLREGRIQHLVTIKALTQTHRSKVVRADRCRHEEPVPRKRARYLRADAGHQRRRGFEVLPSGVPANLAYPHRSDASPGPYSKPPCGAQIQAELPAHREGDKPATITDRFSDTLRDRVEDEPTADRSYTAIRAA